MIKSTFLLAAAILAAPAHSASVVEPSAWVSGIAGTFVAVGTDRVGALGSPALANLSTLSKSAAFPFAAKPEILAPLAKNLSAQGVSPEEFAALPLEGRLATLKIAATQAEVEAAQIADASLSIAEKPLRSKTLNQAARALDETKAIAMYLDRDRRERVAAAGRAQTAFRREWRKKTVEFLSGLGEKMAADSFDTSNILKKTEDGWVATDEGPLARGENIDDLYRRRIADMKDAPQGPWIQREARILEDAMDQNNVVSAFSSSGKSGEWVDIKDQLMNVQLRAMSAGLQDRPLQLARVAFGENAANGTRVPVKHFKTVVERYNAWSGTVASNAPTHVRMLAWIRAGEPDGLPSLSRLIAVRREIASRARRSAAIALGVCLAAYAVFLGWFFSGLGVSGPHLVLGGVAVFSAMAYYIFAFWRHTFGSMALALDTESLEKQVRRVFPND